MQERRGMGLMSRLRNGQFMEYSLGPSLHMSTGLPWDLGIAPWQQRWGVESLTAMPTASSFLAVVPRLFMLSWERSWNGEAQVKALMPATYAPHSVDIVLFVHASLASEAVWTTEMQALSALHIDQNRSQDQWSHLRLTTDIGFFVADSDVLLAHG